MNKRTKEDIINFMFWAMWFTLAIMVVLKLCFNYYYQIIVNDRLLNISHYIDNHLYIEIIINYILNTGNGILLSLCCIQEKWFKSKWHLIIILLFSTIAFPFKYINTWIAFTLILIPYIVVPLIITKNKKRWVFITFVLDNVFQILSNFTRGNNIIVNDTFIITTFLWLDYYIMFIIYYIGGCHMGAGGWLPWFTKKATVIDAKIEKLQKKILKLEAKKQCLLKK